MREGYEGKRWRNVSVGVGKLALRGRWRRYMRKRWGGGKENEMEKGY